ncbi:MAG: hypothetical protein ACE5DY_05920 [Mariprofundaceae bacterium]
MWQSNFGRWLRGTISFVCDGYCYYLLSTVRYVELNPVHANIFDRAEDYKWSSARAHLSGKDDKLVKVEPMLERFEN